MCNIYRPKLLISHKAQLKILDDRGRTPLQSTTNRRCKEKLRDAELREERAAIAEGKKRAVRGDGEKKQICPENQTQ